MVFANAWHPQMAAKFLRAEGQKEEESFLYHLS